MNRYRHLDNLDAAEVPRYRDAIELSKADIQIRDGAYDSWGQLTDPARHSLWWLRPLRGGDLKEFWRLARAQ